MLTLKNFSGLVIYSAWYMALTGHWMCVAGYMADGIGAIAQYALVYRRPSSSERGNAMKYAIIKLMYEVLVSWS